ncbi:hypothetical protein [Solitalea koreensis]|uniref:DUF1565 domain-containing protein n=1 Tax=Solitalea koreensis TaxID=543615 RepID=A0A521BP74_9SPHI|nr:hypothetical protein [Solitalea koreensis]SMO48571.1 hypothetical protein SAMN06265350_102368 [Solitalea koreensis]
MLKRIFLSLQCVLLILTLFAQKGKLVSKEYHVAVNGSNNNNGSISKPFKTISAAAKKAMRDVIIVHAGVYRGQVAPLRCGNSEKERIWYGAAKGEKFEVKGSVTKNFLHDNRVQDFSLEVNHGPVMVGNNLFLSQVRLSQVAFLHNLIAWKLWETNDADPRPTPFLKPHSTAIAGFHINPSGDAFTTLFFWDEQTCLLQQIIISRANGRQCELDGCKTIKSHQEEIISNTPFTKNV